MDAYLQEEGLDARIAALAHRHHGVVDIGQLYALGASRTQIGRRIATRRLLPLHRGVYAVGHRRLTQPGVWLAAVRALGSRAVLSFLHGAALWELRPPPGGKVNVTVPGRGRRQRKGIRVHSTVDLPSDHVTVRDAIPVTTPARTLADLAGAIERPQLLRALEAAEFHAVLDVPSLLAVSAGRPGADAIRQLLGMELPHTRSDFEASLLDLCDRFEIPRPAMNVIVGGIEVDAVWHDRRLVVELDSWRHHGTRAAFERDRERDAELHALGFATLRVTYHQLTTRPRWVAAKLSPRRA